MQWSQRKLIVVALALAAVGALVFFMADRREALPGPSGSGGNGSSTTEEWKTYRNREYGFELEYPPSFSVDDGNKRFVSLSDGAVIINIDADAQYSEDFDSSIECARTAFGKNGILKTLSIEGRKALLCFAQVENQDGTRFVTDYVIVVPRAASVGQIPHRSYIELDLAIVGESSLAESYEKTFEEILETLRFL